MNNELLAFLNGYGQKKIVIVENTRLYQDLNIYGDDATEFLEEYGKKFNVNLSEFNFSKYFPFEGEEYLFLFEWIKSIFRTPKKTFDELTVSKLDNGINDGYLR